MNPKTKKRLVWVPVMILALFWLMITGVPFMYMVLSTFKQRFEILTNGVFAFPASFYTNNYVEVLTGAFWTYFRNSVLVAAVSLTILLFISACAAYPLSRLKFKLNKPIFGLIIAAMSVPIHVTLIPVFLMMSGIGLYDTPWALIGPYVAFNLPISVFILTTFMAGIPRELEEAADIDGCGKYRTFFFIMLPLSVTGLATLAIYNAVNMWNEFSFALVLTQSPRNRTLPLAIWEYQGQYTNDIPMIMTVLTLSVVPMIIAFIIGQEKMIKGMMAGAVKG